MLLLMMMSLKADFLDSSEADVLFGKALISANHILGLRTPPL